MASGTAAASKIKHAHLLLHVDANGPTWSDAHVATALPCHGHMVRNVRQRFVAHGLVAVLIRKKQARARAEELWRRPLQAHCPRDLGRLYTKTGQQEQARAELSMAREMDRTMEMPFWLPQVEAALTQVEGQ